MHPLPTAVELLASQHRTDRLTTAARRQPSRRPARAAAAPASWAWSDRLRRALHPAAPAAAPCCA